MIAMGPRWRAVLMLVAVAALAVVAAGFRKPALRAAGWALVVDEMVASADIIVISLDSDGAGALEAAQLVQSGVAKRAAVFMGAPSELHNEFIRRGVPDDDRETDQVRQLRALGVTDIMRISPVTGTEDEVDALRPWCDEHQFRSVVFVAHMDHTRRLRRVLDRVMRRHPTRVAVKAARYTPNFDPDRWWETRNSTRTELIEFEKLLVDIVLHPMLF